MGGKARSLSTSQSSLVITHDLVRQVGVRRMSPLYGKYMNDPTTREELLSIIANK